MDSSTVKPPSFSGQFNKPCVKFTVDVVTPTTIDRLMAGSRRLFQMERQNRMPQLPAMKSSSSPGFTQKDALQNHIIEDLLEISNSKTSTRLIRMER